MFADLTYLSFEATTGGFVRVELSTTSLDEDRPENRRPYESVILTIAEAYFAADCMDDTAPFIPFFNDGIHLLMLTPGGARITHFDGGVNRRVYGTDDYETGYFSRKTFATFPAGEFSYLLRMAARQATRLKADVDRMRAECNDETVPYFERRDWDYDVANARWRHTVHHETIAYFARKYAPHIRMVFHRDTDKYYLQALHDPRVTNKDNYSLKEQMQARARSAKNSSNGQLVTVNVYPDHLPSENRPMSFYWVMSDKDRNRIMNGGIIAHANRSKDPETNEFLPNGTFEYSTHT
jgi:hypothetical protein